MRLSDEDREEVRELLSQGLSDREVAVASRVSQNTIGRWRRSWPPIAIRWRPAHEQSYAYLLGLYLGDGWLSVVRGGVTLRITLDLRYPRIIDECRIAMVLSMPKHRPGILACSGCEAVQVQVCGKLWLHAFPQHGPGRKHERPISLEPWQQEIVSRHPGEFVRGLIHSDGCRTINRFRTALPSGRVAEYAYPRYFFSNLSGDIRALFCATCDVLGLRWTLSNPRNVSVAHRKSVAVLDALGCAKE
ncbi:MAG: helix-turn-helix domain-containing protein [Actinobacteria bacterium]|nr:helix-turn-helix domain-containing protein [Actinomycetota bacterium]